MSYCKHHMGYWLQRKEGYAKTSCGMRAWFFMLVGALPSVSAKLGDPSLLTLRRGDGVQSISSKRQGLGSVAFVSVTVTV
jgi:hypothetical protein